MATVNAELQKKIEEVGRANNDLSNLLASTGMGTLFVDHQLRVQRFTPATSRVISSIQTEQPPTCWAWSAASWSSSPCFAS